MEFLNILLSMDPVTLSAFVLAGLLLNITPGADFVFVTANSIVAGPHIGRAAGIGINVGVLVHIAAAERLGETAGGGQDVHVLVRALCGRAPHR